MNFLLSLISSPTVSDGLLYLSLMRLRGARRLQYLLSAYPQIARFKLLTAGYRSFQ